MFELDTEAEKNEVKERRRKQKERWEHLKRIQMLN